jgi:hypothetical protein
MFLGGERIPRQGELYKNLECLCFTGGVVCDLTQVRQTRVSFSGVSTDCNLR